VSYRYRAVEKFWRNFHKLPNDQRSLSGARGSYSGAIHFIHRFGRTKFTNYRLEQDTPFTPR
jgi:hypothetical protein